MAEPARPLPTFVEPYRESNELKTARARAIRVTAEYRETLLLELEAVDQTLAALRREQAPQLPRTRRNHRSGIYHYLDLWVQANPGARTDALSAYRWVVAAGWDTSNVHEPRKSVGSALGHMYEWGRLHKMERGLYEAPSAEEQAAAEAAAEAKLA